MWEQLLQWDQETLIYFNNLGSERFDIFWLITTNFITWIPLFLFIIIHLIRNYSKKELQWIFLSYLSMLTLLIAVIFVCKYNVARLRPINDVSFNQLLRVLTHPTDYSFFSGHASSSFSIVTLAYLYLRGKLKWTYLLFIWPMIFSFSRVYLGVHYPLDIIIGCLVGMFFAWIFYSMHQKFRAPYIL